MANAFPLVIGISASSPFGLPVRASDRHEHVCGRLDRGLHARRRLQEPGASIPAGDGHFCVGRHGLPVRPRDGHQHVCRLVDRGLHARHGLQEPGRHVHQGVGHFGFQCRHGLPVRPSTGTNTFVATNPGLPARLGLFQRGEHLYHGDCHFGAANDTADLYGASTGTNTFVGTSTSSYLQGTGYMNVANNFKNVLAVQHRRATRPP